MDEIIDVFDSSLMSSDKIREIARRRMAALQAAQDELDALWDETIVETRENIFKGLRISGFSEEQISVILKNSEVELWKKW